MLQDDEQQIQENRQEIAGLVRAYFNQTREWVDLSLLLSRVAHTFKYRQLFTTAQCDKQQFMEDEKNPAKRLTREVVGFKNENFHLTFFALAPGFRGKAHNHSGVNCISVVLEGPFTEVLYSENTESLLSVSKVEFRQQGNVSADLTCFDNKFIHSVGNYSADPVYSLHVYGISTDLNFNCFYENLNSEAAYTQTFSPIRPCFLANFSLWKKYNITALEKNWESRQPESPNVPAVYRRSHQ